MLLRRLFRFSLSVSLLFLLFLTACDEQSINLNQIVTQEIITELTEIENAEEPVYDEKLWLITDVLQNKKELHGQVVSIVGYVGWQGELSNVWVVQIWNEPVGNYEDMWKYGRVKEYETEIDKWDTCRVTTNCWNKGEDYAGIRYLDPSWYPPAELVHPDNRKDLPYFYPADPPPGDNRPAYPGPETPFYGEPDPGLTFIGSQKRPGIALESLDKYVLKVLVRDWGPGAGLTLIEIVDHEEMPKEQPPPSINEDNPMTVKKFIEQWENFYDQTVSVRGYTGGFSTGIHGLDSFGFHHDKSKDSKEWAIINVYYPYGKRIYFWKMAHQGLRQGGPYIIRIHVHSPETNTIRGRLLGSEKTFQELYPFVILWVDGDREENLSKAHSWW